MTKKKGILYIRLKQKVPPLLSNESQLLGPALSSCLARATVNQHPPVRHNGW